MKRMKTWVVLLVILAISMSMLVACRPADDEGGDLVSNEGGLVNTDPNGENPGDETPGSDTPGTDNPGGNTNPGGGNNNNPGGGNTNPGGGNNTNPGGGNNKNPGGSDIYENPLMKKGKKYNNDAAVSYDIDKTGFVKKGKLADLKGKTLTLFTAVDYAQWTYFNAKNKYTTEWDWFKELKRTYGVTVKYVRCYPGTNVLKPFQAMNAGKDCDLIATHVTSFPYICNIMAPLDDYCDFSKMSNSPGLDPKVTKATRWKGKNIVVGPCLVSGIFFYNQTFVKNAGLDDPYALYKKGEWNWTNFKKYMIGLPKTTSTGKKVYGCSTIVQWWYWANTNGKAVFEIDGENPNGGIINNFDSAEVKETYLWLESVMDAGGQYLDADSGPAFYNTDKSNFCAMAYGWYNIDTKGMDPDDPNKKNSYFWVPFPKNEKNPKTINHVEVYGFAIGMPRKTNKEGNRAAAAKFCELWCNRYTEARFDFLIDRSQWTYDQVVEYYEIGKNNGLMGLGSGVGNLSGWANDKATNFNLSIVDASYSVASSMAKLSNYAKTEMDKVLKFGMQ